MTKVSDTLKLPPFERLRVVLEMFDAGTDAHEAIDHLYHACPECGKRQTYTDDEAAELLEASRRLRKDDPGTLHSILNIAAVCDKCFQKIKWEKSAARLERKRQQHIRHHYALDLMPEEAKAATFQLSSPEVEAHHPDFWKYSRTLPLDQNLWIQGRPDTGKTFMALAILNHHLEAGYKVLSTTAITINKLGSRFDANEWVKRYAEPDLLHIDDADKADWSRQSFELLYEVIDRRHKNKRWIVWTANDSPQGWKNTLIGMAENRTVVPAMFSRFNPCKVIHLEGQALRRKAHIS